MQSCVRASNTMSAAQGPILCEVSKRTFLRCHKKKDECDLGFRRFRSGPSHRSRVGGAVLVERWSVGHVRNGMEFESSVGPSPWCHVSALDSCLPAVLSPHLSCFRSSVFRVLQEHRCEEPAPGHAPSTCCG